MRTPDQSVQEAMRNLPQAFTDWLRAERDDMRAQAEKPRVTGSSEHTQGQCYAITQILGEVENAVRNG